MDIDADTPTSSGRVPAAPVDVAVVAMTAAHWPAVADIYARGIETGHATFETQAPSWEEFDESHLREHRLVAEDADGRVLGWAAVSPSSGRCVYAGVVEASVYVHPAAAGRGVGRRLLERLVASAEEAGIWTVQAGVFPENQASLTLHRHAGFCEVGVRRRLGLMTHGPCVGQWRDVVMLERRSTTTGV